MDAIVTPDQVDKIPPTISRHQLLVPVVAAYLHKGYKQVEIAQIHNCSRQWVDEFIEIHKDEIANILGYDDVMPMLIKHNNVRIELSLDDNDIKKAGLVGKRTALGIGTDKLAKTKSDNLDSDINIIIKIHQNVFKVECNKPDPIDITPDNDSPVPPVTGDNDHS